LSHNTRVALFGRYAYVAELGRGSTGRVFAAVDRTEADAPRALKVVDESQAGRLLWEYGRLSRLEHPRVARVRELLRAESAVGAPFSLPARSLVLVEDRAPGVPLSLLSQRLEQSPRERLELVLALGSGIAEALAAVHDVGLVHGDVKPDNVLWDAAHGATVVDLGFARAPSVDAPVRGTPRFMAPELLSGLSTPAADVFALGALLFDWLVGEAPNAGSSRGSSEDTVWFPVRDLGWLARPGALSLPEGHSDLEPLAQLLQSFLARDPETRVSDGRAALNALIGLASSLGRPVNSEQARFAGTAAMAPLERSRRARTLPFVGHARTVAQLAQAIDARLERASIAGPVYVLGPRTAGHSRLVREALRSVQERRAEQGRALPTWVRSSAALAALRDVNVVLWLERPSAEELAQALRAQAAHLAVGRALCVVVEGL
jgi:hypothetical protein